MCCCGLNMWKTEGCLGRVWRSQIVGFMGQPGECSESVASWLPHSLSCIFIVSWELLVGVKLHLCFSVLSHAHRKWKKSIV